MASVAAHCASSRELFPIALKDSSSGPSTEVGSDDSKSDSDFSDDDDDPNPTHLNMDNTMLIFDWDDTILATSWLQAQGLRPGSNSRPTPEQQEKLNNLAQQAAFTLHVAQQFGKVVLITNAGHGWIEHSCQKYMPTLYPYLKNVQKVSARAMFEKHGVVSPFEWKFFAFQREILSCYSGFRSDQQKNVISFGDAAYEREAVIRVTDDLVACHTKSVKFMEKPDIDQLMKQHEIINGCLKEIVQRDGCFDLCIRG